MKPHLSFGIYSIFMLKIVLSLFHQQNNMCEYGGWKNWIPEGPRLRRDYVAVEPHGSPSWVAGPVLRGDA
jgi:hypothetical protein